MTRVTLLAVLACVTLSGLVGGCYTPTLTQSAHEHAHQWKSVARRDRLALNEDIDAVLQTDRPSRLTKWHDQ